MLNEKKFRAIYDDFPASGLTIRDYRANCLYWNAAYFNGNVDGDDASGSTSVETGHALSLPHPQPQPPSQQSQSPPPLTNQQKPLGNNVANTSKHSAIKKHSDLRFKN